MYLLQLCNVLPHDTLSFWGIQQLYISLLPRLVTQLHGPFGLWLRTAPSVGVKRLSIGSADGDMPEPDPEFTHNPLAQPSTSPHAGVPASMSLHAIGRHTSPSPALGRKRAKETVAIANTSVAIHREKDIPEKCHGLHHSLAV